MSGLEFGMDMIVAVDNAFQNGYICLIPKIGFI